MQIKSLTKIIRKDPFTSAGTSLSFCEWVQNIDYGTISDLSLLLVEVTDNLMFNWNPESNAFDEYWKWIGHVLHGGILSNIFRLGRCEFVVLLTENHLTDHKQLAKAIVNQLNKEAKQFNINKPIAKGVLVFPSASEKLSQTSIFDLLRFASRKLCQIPIGSIRSIQGRSLIPNTNLSWLVKNISIQMVELGKKIDETYHMANSDPLTGLPNVRAALCELDVVYSGSQIVNDQFAVIMIDGDGLKEMNKFGYAEGDKYICELAEIQKGGLRNGDFLARWKMGDEFLVILNNTSSEMAYVIAERLRSKVENASQNWLLPMSISLGVAIYPEHGKTIDELLCKAEKALKTAKEKGKNQVVSADGIDDVLT